jgi:hypothetical protein
MTFELVDGRRITAAPRCDLAAPYAVTFRLSQLDHPPDQLPRVARELVAQHLRTRGTTSLLDDARLVTSELVTNAVRHALERPSDRILLRLLPGAGSLWIGVIDPSPKCPRLDTPTPLADSGRGLCRIVDALTNENWGYELLPYGKIVWAQLTCPRA